MEFTELVDEIVTRVTARMAEQTPAVPSGKPKLLVLTPDQRCAHYFSHGAVR